MLVHVKARLIAALVALIAVPGVVAWGLLAPHAKAVSDRTAEHVRPIVYPSPIANPLTLQRVPDTKAGWKVVFSQKFTGTTLNTRIWGTCYPWHDVSAGCSNFGNAEYEWYLPKQDSVSGGMLHLTAARKVTQGTKRDGSPQTYYCRSGMVTSYPSFRFEYGYAKVVAWLPKGAGLWSGIWLAVANLKWPPEIDLSEHWGEPWIRTGVYFHPAHAHGAKAHLSLAEDKILSSGWHSYSLSWNYHRITWFVDGTPIMTVAQNVTHQKMYLIMNLADYSHPKATCFGQLRIKSVKVWQRT